MVNLPELITPLNPNTTNHVQVWQRVESILAVEPQLHKVAWVTSTEWGQIAKELEGYEVTDPSKPTVKPQPMNFRQMRIGKCLLLRNAGTEDQDVVDLLNIREMGSDKVIFDFRKNNLRTG